MQHFIDDEIHQAVKEADQRLDGVRMSQETHLSRDNCACMYEQAVYERRTERFIRVQGRLNGTTEVMEKCGGMFTLW
jgi:hypothetical protein